MVLRNEVIRKRRLKRIRLLLRLWHLRMKRRRLQLCMRTPRRWHVRPIFQTRSVDGNHYNLVPKMRLDDPVSFQNYFRMSPEVFDELLSFIKPYLPTEDCLYRNKNAIPNSLKLGLTLRYLASGDAMVSMSFAERVGRSTVSKILVETCEAIWLAMKERVMPALDAESFATIAEGYFNRWNFPNCCGSMDGKHVVLQAPDGSGSAFYNFKKDHSIVLMAVCDANYCFTCVDIGAEGRHNDSRTFSNWNFGERVLENTLPLPPPINLFGFTLPPVFVADEAFPLKVNIMRPFPNRNLLPQKRVYNYRLSRARRIIENCFGIWAARWRIFRKPIIAGLVTVDGIVKATVCLHNFLQKKSNERRLEDQHSYCPSALVDYEDENGFHPGQWRTVQMDGLQPVCHQGANNHSRNAASVRDEYMRYFWNQGRVPWQDKIFNA